MDSSDNESFEETPEKMLTLSTDAESLSISYHHKDSMEEIEEESSTNCSYIREVYKDNIDEAFKEIGAIIKKYKYIGMDTEFPGCVYGLKNLTKDFYYKTLKINVNSTKLIQLGITFTNEKGEFPEKYKYHTFQFNFEFDSDKDKYSEESLNLLKNNGINFEKLKKNGISEKDFGEKLMTSGLVLNPSIKWVSYQGSYDFAYLLKLLINDNLPESEDEFMNLLKLYFPTFFDIRMLVRDDENLFHGGLSKLISKIDIERKGINHQAGSDSIATIEAFHKLKENGNVDNDKIKSFKNVLYGLGIGEDNENTIKYINKNNMPKLELNRAKSDNYSQNAYNHMTMNQPINPMLYLQQQQIQRQKQLNNIIFYKNINNCVPYVFINSCQMMGNNIFLNNINKMKPVQIKA